MLVCLQSNSIRHNPDGCEIHILGYKKENYVILAVRDTGKGISDEIIKILEEKSKREETSEQKNLKWKSPISWGCVSLSRSRLPIKEILLLRKKVIV